jgi:PAS domain-containing protein
MNKQKSNQIEFIDAMPGFISIIDLNLRYLAVNKKLANLMNIDTENFKGMTVGTRCYEQRKSIENLVNSPVGTEINWEYYYHDTCLLVSSKRQDDFIINQAIDISDRKNLEENLKAANERNRILLKTIPDAIKSGAGRRSTDELQCFISSLIDNPIIDQRQSNEALIRLEVEVRQNSLRMQRLEEMLFMGESPLITKIKELEINQINDNKNWQDFEDNKDKIENLSRISAILTSVPGGLRTWLIIFIIFQMVGIFFIDVGIRVFNLESIIPIERKQPSP